MRQKTGEKEREKEEKAAHISWLQTLQFGMAEKGERTKAAMNATTAKAASAISASATHPLRQLDSTAALIETKR